MVASDFALTANPRVSISGSEIPSGIISSVTVETAIDKEDLISLTILNPIDGSDVKGIRSTLRYIDSIAFMAGQILEIEMEQNGEYVSLGVGIIQEWMPMFPESGLPTLTLKALGGGSYMMNGNGEINAKDARTFAADLSVSDIVEIIAADYGFDTDIEYTFDVPKKAIVKKAGMSDYQFVKGLASLLGFDFYVRHKQQEKFELVFKELQVEDTFTDKMSFTWGPTYINSRGLPLLTFEPSFAVDSNPSNVEVYYFDNDGSVWEKVIYPVDEKDKGKSNELQWVGDPITGQDVSATSVEEDLANTTTADSARGLRIKAGGFSIEVVPSEGISSAEEAVNFARAWWKQRSRSMILGRGKTYGFNKIKAGQVHELAGIGAGLSGDWYFSEVNHSYTEGVYSLDFICRKVIE